MLTIDGTIVNGPPITKYFQPITNTANKTNECAVAASGSRSEVSQSSANPPQKAIANDEADRRATEVAVQHLLSTETAATSENSQESNNDEIMELFNEQQPERPVTPGASLFAYDDNDVFDKRNALWNPTKSPVIAVREKAAQLKEVHQTSMLSISKQKVNPVTTPYLTASTSRCKITSATKNVTQIHQNTSCGEENVSSVNVCSKKSDDKEKDDKNQEVIQKELTITTSKIKELEEQIQKLNRENETLKKKRDDMSPSRSTKTKDVSKSHRHK